MASATPPEAPRISLRALSWEFLKIGAIGHDLGPLLAFLEAEFVNRRKVLTLDDINEALTYTKPLPGSTVIQIAAYLAYRLRGWPGSAVATWSYLLPSIVMMVVLAAGYVAVGTIPAIRPALTAVTAAVAGILVATAYRLSSRNIDRRKPLTIALAAAAFGAGAFLGINVAVITIVAGAIGVLFLAPPAGAPLPQDRRMTPKSAPGSSR